MFHKIESININILFIICLTILIHVHVLQDLNDTLFVDERERDEILIFSRICIMSVYTTLTVFLCMMCHGISWLP